MSGLVDKINTGGNVVGAFHEFSMWALQDMWSMRADVARLFGKGTSMLQWFFSKYCNLDCSYCGVPDSDKKDMDSETRKEYFDIMQQIFRPRVLNITGGEPTLKFGELVNFLDHGRKKVPFRSLVSNGLLLDERKIKELAKAGLQYLGVSYDGVPPKNNPAALDAAQFASQQGIIATMQPVLTQVNWDQRYELQEEALRRGLMFAPIVVQTLGNEYSTQEEQTAGVANVREYYQEMIDQALHPRLRLKHRGKFLKYLAEHYGEPWMCKDFNWVTVNNDGTLKHCNEFNTEFRVPDLLDPKKRADFNQARQDTRDSCNGCYYDCYYYSEQGMTGQLSPTAWGQLEYVTRWTRFARGMQVLDEIITRRFPEFAARLEAE